MSAVEFHSILFDRPQNRVDERPSFFSDLNLDQVLESMIVDREQYDLRPFFDMPLRDVAAVRYRHAILRDLEKEQVLSSVQAFARQMRSMRAQIAQAEKRHYKYQRERWFVDAVAAYCDAVSGLVNEFTSVNLEARGFLAFRDYLTDYTESDRFTSLTSETREVRNALGAVKYCVRIRANRVRVSKYDGEADYSEDVEHTFAKFKQGAAKDYRMKLPDWPDMNHVEARILDLVARLYPDAFSMLDDYCARHVDYLDTAIGAFDRQIQFYVAYLEYIERFKRAGLPFCYPRISDSKEIYARDACDIALANKLVPENSAVVCNDFYLNDPERVIVVTGPNQGGKTTFARMFGQLHYLASLGYPVPGREAALFLPDRLFTHFEREEDLATLRGKLEDELFRMHEIIQQATSRSIVIVNEGFTSTTLRDSLSLGRAVMNQLIELGPLCVYVTFVDELASLSETTVSMVSTIVPDNPALRTYKIVRRPADGLAYAAAIAQKYGLTYDGLRRRIGP